MPLQVKMKSLLFLLTSAVVSHAQEFQVVEHDPYAIDLTNSSDNQLTGERELQTEAIDYACFQQTPVYGTKYPDSMFASDLPYIRTHTLGSDFAIKLLNVCGADTGSYMSFTGIQGVLTNGVDKRMKLNQIGATSPCDSWILPQEQWFETI